MVRPIIRYSLILLLLASASAAFQKAEPLISDALMDKGLAHGFPGFILAVQKGDEDVEINAKGLADLENKTAILPNDRFHVASVTKIFTATAALVLVDKGMLALDTRVTDVLNKQLLAGIPFIDEITVEQLLDHSSGIYGFNNDKDYIDIWLGSKYKANKIWTDGELIAFANKKRQKPFGKPGTGHYYSDTNYVLLRLVIEKRSGMSLRQFVKQKILEPLLLNETGYFGKQDDTDFVSLKPTVNGYLKQSKTLDSVVKLDKSFKSAGKGLLNTTAAVERLDGPSGMVSTAHDLALFGRALYSGKLLKKSSLDWLLSRGRGIDSDKAGSSRQGVIKFHREKYGVLYASNGDGPAGINVTLAYHPASDTVLVGFTNIFGPFDEADFIREEIFAELVKTNTKLSSRKR